MLYNAYNQYFIDILTLFDLRINFFYVYVFGCFVLVELRSLGIKAIWELTHKWVLAPKYARSKASKALKGFIYVFVLKLTHHYY